MQHIRLTILVRRSSTASEACLLPQLLLVFSVAIFVNDQSILLW